MKKKKAVALKYSKYDLAPKITAKGKNEIAEKIIELAKESGVAIHEDKDLVEILDSFDVGYEIPENLYGVIAEVLAFVYLANEKYTMFTEESD